jgi:phage FluMu gp28-like protein
MDVKVAGSPFDAIVNRVLLPYQREDVFAPDRFRWNCWSRQTGKSFGKAMRRILRGVARKRDQLFLSAGERQSRELMMKAQQHCKALQIAFSTDERDAGVFDDVQYKSLEIHIPEAGIRIIGLPANPATARGFTGDVFLDEFSMHRHDREIWGAMFPSIMRGGGELDVASTPKGKQNVFYTLRDNESFGHQTVTINDAVDQGLDVDPGVLKAAMGDEELYRQEFLCEFIDEATAFLTLDMITGCEDDDLRYDLDLDELAAHKGDVLVGVDVGRRRDLTVIWALDQVAQQLISLGLIELRSTSFREQFEILCQVMECRCVRKCCIDATGLGMQLAEQTAERFGTWRVEGVTFTAPAKEQMAGKLRVRMEGKTVRLPVSKAIRDDLHSIEKFVSLDGHIRLRASRQEGSHADRFWALALATHAASDDMGPIEATFGPDLHFARSGAW